MNLCWFGKKNISTRQHGAFPKPSQCPRQLVGFWIMTFALQPARGFLCHLLSPCIFSLNCGVTTLSHKRVKQCAYKAECQQCPGRACHGGGWPSSPVSRPVFYNPVAMRSQTWCCPRGEGSIREDSLSVSVFTSPKHKPSGIFCWGTGDSLAWNKKVEHKEWGEVAMCKMKPSCFVGFAILQNPCRAFYPSV